MDFFCPPFTQWIRPHSLRILFTSVRLEKDPSKLATVGPLLFQSPTQQRERQESRAQTRIPGLPGVGPLTSSEAEVGATKHFARSRCQSSGRYSRPFFFSVSASLVLMLPFRRKQLSSIS